VQATYAFIRLAGARAQPLPGPRRPADPRRSRGQEAVRRCRPAAPVATAERTSPICRSTTLAPVAREQRDRTIIQMWDAAGWDTPTLIEVWRTAPYLHLGTAVTVKDVMTTENKKKMHGNAADMSAQQLDQLAGVCDADRAHPRERCRRCPTPEAICRIELRLTPLLPQAAGREGARPPPRQAEARTAVSRRPTRTVARAPPPRLRQEGAGR
jgi:hypothetical protein